MSICLLSISTAFWQHYIEQLVSNSNRKHVSLSLTCISIVVETVLFILDYHSTHRCVAVCCSLFILWPCPVLVYLSYPLRLSTHDISNLLSLPLFPVIQAQLSPPWKHNQDPNLTWMDFTNSSLHRQTQKLCHEAGTHCCNQMQNHTPSAARLCLYLALPSTCTHPQM